MDKIFIHALKTEAIIGIFDWERQMPPLNGPAPRR